jgi:glycine oxidase
MPTIAQARNPRLLKSLKAFLLQQPQVEFIENCKVHEIVQKNNRIQSVNTSTGKIEVNHLIIAAGAWTAELTQNLFAKKLQKPQIAPVKGQMLLFQAQPEILPYMVLDEDHYLIPRRDGKILAGSSVEHVGFDKSTNQLTKNKLKSFAFDLFPELKNFFLLAHWAGLRPGTEHGIPYIDNHPEIENLSINAGHFRNGLTMAPASAQLMADLILNRPAVVACEPYKLTR